MKGCRAASCLLTLWACAAASTASTFVAMSERQMVRQAEAVVEGRVVGLESFWSEDGRVVVTEAEIAVDEVIVGDAPALVRVRTFGGSVDGVRVEPQGFPRFEADERVVVFLRTEPADGTRRVLGYQQGHFRVVTRRDGVTLAVPMVEEARLIAPSGRLARAPHSVELARFKSALRELAAREGRVVR